MESSFRTEIEKIERCVRNKSYGRIAGHIERIIGDKEAPNPIENQYLQSLIYYILHDFSNPKQTGEQARLVLSLKTRREAETVAEGIALRVTLVNWEDAKTGFTAVSSAAKENCTRVLSCLLQKPGGREMLDQMDHQDKNPIDWAREEGHEEIVEQIRFFLASGSILAAPSPAPQPPIYEKAFPALPPRNAKTPPPLRSARTLPEPRRAITPTPQSTGWLMTIDEQWGGDEYLSFLAPESRCEKRPTTSKPLAGRCPSPWLEDDIRDLRELETCSVPSAVPPFSRSATPPPNPDLLPDFGKRQPRGTCRPTPSPAGSPNLPFQPPL